MVLESLIDDETIIRKPTSMLIESFVVSSIALWTAFYTFPGSASILSIAFITMALIPLVYSVMIKEETIESIVPGHPLAFIGRHFEIIKIFSFFFIGLSLSYAIWFVVLPETTESISINGITIQIPDRKSVFAEQQNTLKSIENLRSAITGKITQTNCVNNKACIFDLIFFNNAEVMFFALILSLVYGAGALMLLGWNASIIGALIGKSILAENHLMFLGLLPHGIPEILAYFFATISGLMLSIVITKKSLRKNEIKIIFFDSITIFLIAMISLAIGALIESLLIVKNEELALAISMSYIIAFSLLIFFGINRSSE
jgi:uncharacterized membrane protein SpoIIM required for sporulation